MALTIEMNFKLFFDLSLIYMTKDKQFVNTGHY